MVDARYICNLRAIFIYKLCEEKKKMENEIWKLAKKENPTQKQRQNPYSCKNHIIFIWRDIDLTRKFMWKKSSDVINLMHQFRWKCERICLCVYRYPFHCFASKFDSQNWRRFRWIFLSPSIVLFFSARREHERFCYLHSQLLQRFTCKLNCVIFWVVVVVVVGKIALFIDCMSRVYWTCNSGQMILDSFFQQRKPPFVNFHFKHSFLQDFDGAPHIWIGNDNV